MHLDDGETGVLIIVVTGNESSFQFQEGASQFDALDDGGDDDPRR